MFSRTELVHTGHLTHAARDFRPSRRQRGAGALGSWSTTARGCCPRAAHGVGTGPARSRGLRSATGRAWQNLLYASYDAPARVGYDRATLPAGDQLTPRMLRQLGRVLGMSDGAEKLHYVLELPEGSRRRRQSTRTTCTWSGRSPRRRPNWSRPWGVWLTNEYEHNALRADGGQVLDRLISLARGL
jgi:hypothetical protein